MIRITLMDTAEKHTTMKVEGRIVSDWIEVMETEFKNLLAEGKIVALDLSEVTFVEPEGVHMIRGILDKGCVLSSCPLFIHHVLFTQITS
ncbi:hypothetical protein [Candidatus Nitrospira neomarina]|uniref:STAS domain-containing protein n=1 Tax=Candidatus Nitrospira neomarina TaxID=3020899 RepID=A0AA96GU41_9BACT|nr:hypothetical protein [Candidatus Nitrospira neomarina]WNM64129.1 hypothetical protein PQG83_10345 [Candidatus Nitrospira neomarina]